MQKNISRYRYVLLFQLSVKHTVNGEQMSGRITGLRDGFVTMGEYLECQISWRGGGNVRISARWYMFVFILFGVTTGITKTVKCYVAADPNIDTNYCRYMR